MGNIFTVTLPDIGEGVVEGEVIEWLKAVGDSVQQDEPIVSVMTDKATVELPAPKPGVLSKQYFQPGETAIVDKPLYDLEVEFEVKKKEGKKQTVVVQKKKTKSVSSENKVLATPQTRGLAKKLGIDINQITGTGEDGRVVPTDLHQISPGTPPLRLEDDIEQPLIGVKKLMAKSMAESKRTIPHFSYFEQIDATRLIQLRNKYKEQGQKEKIRVTYTPFLIRALSLTIRQFPIINSSYDSQNERLLIHKQQNIGIAMSTPEGLIVPVLKGVQNYNLEELIHHFEELKSKKYEREDMTEATISISNFGVLGDGGRWATPIINPPEVAILAVAKIQKQAVVQNDEVVARDTLNVSWSFDHRVMDGDMAAQVSHHFAELVRNPASLI